MNRFIFCTVVFLFCLTACSKAQSEVQINEFKTIKALVTNKSEAAVWTNELEPGLLSATSIGEMKIAEGVYPTKNLILVAESNNDEKIYPQIKDFGSLNTESLSSSSRKLAASFFDALCNDVFTAETYFKPESVFSLVFFSSDLENGFLKNREQKKEGEKLFTSYLIGSPFLSGSEVQVPVRLYKNKEFVDISLFIDEKQNKISQVKIERWGE